MLFLSFVTPSFPLVYVIPYLSHARFADVAPFLLSSLCFPFTPPPYFCYIRLFTCTLSIEEYIVPIAVSLIATCVYVCVFSPAPLVVNMYSCPPSSAPWCCDWNFYSCAYIICQFSVPAFAFFGPSFVPLIPFFPTFSSPLHPFPTRVCHIALFPT